MPLKEEPMTPGAPAAQGADTATRPADEVSVPLASLVGFSPAQGAEPLTVEALTALLERTGDNDDDCSWKTYPQLAQLIVARFGVPFPAQGAVDRERLHDELWDCLAHCHNSGGPYPSAEAIAYVKALLSPEHTPTPADEKRGRDRDGSESDAAGVIVADGSSLTGDTALRAAGDEA